ncbi:hypothetical protein [Ferrimonas sp.]|uniref:hypothetical protein n=1 Tax=Ferrimonas sp. TaxID=2080861 RepID=UPI003A8E6BF1
MEQVLEMLRDREYDAEMKDGKVMVKLGFMCNRAIIAYDYALAKFTVNSGEVRIWIGSLIIILTGAFGYINEMSMALIALGFISLMSVILTEVKLIEVRRLVTDINLMRKQEQH